MQEAVTTSLSERVSAVLRSSEAVVPRATYRLQFHKDFTFDHAIEILPYLKRLGISHVYASPLLMARSGSTHGYDIIDHNRMNPELGGEEGFHRFSQALQQHGLGLVLDFVPNHMGVGAANRWWRDVLKHGRCSRFAHYFDIDWNPLKGELRNKLLLPTLGGPYGQVLESGNLQLHLKDGEIELCYYDHSFPVALNSLPLLFEGTSFPAELLQRLRDLPEHCATSPSQVESRLQLTPELERAVRQWLSTDEGVRVASEVLKQVNGTPGDPASFDRLHQFLELQAYRLSFWRVSGEEINYRRFFDVNDLVGVRQEFPDVFASTHRLIRRLLGTGQLDGIRIDHVDGLYNPRQYLIRLQML
ncbi:MAG TPA: alpha-amylase family glycosyl hydrolase, partial [Terriglobales bacterium]